MKVLVSTRSAEAEEVEGIEFTADVDELLRRSDFVRPRPAPCALRPTHDAAAVAAHYTAQAYPVLSRFMTLFPAL